MWIRANHASPIVFTKAVRCAPIFVANGLAHQASFVTSQGRFHGLADVLIKTWMRFDRSMSWRNRSSLSSVHIKEVAAFVRPAVPCGDVPLVNTIINVFGNLPEFSMPPRWACSSSSSHTPPIKRLPVVCA